MLDEYKTIQPISYKILKNTIHNKKWSHAYLFETNNFYDANKLIESFVKSLMCPHQYTNNDNCHKCNQCQIIENGNHPEVEIIKPDGMWIKKDQLTKLQQSFNKKAIIGNKKIYIITQADRLNKQAANSILKFLEEPEEGIIAILVTENIYNVLETIVSRCQILKLKNVKKESNISSTLDYLYQEFYKDQEQTPETYQKIEKPIKFINYYENNKIKTLLYTKKLWHDYIKSKEELIKSFNIITLYYNEILYSLTGKQTEIFIDYKQEIEKIKEKNNIQSIATKIKKITNLKEQIKYNINTNLLIDKLIITLESEE